MNTVAVLPARALTLMEIDTRLATVQTAVEVLQVQAEHTNEAIRALDAAGKERHDDLLDVVRANSQRFDVQISQLSEQVEANRAAISMAKTTTKVVGAIVTTVAAFIGWVTGFFK